MYVTIVIASLNTYCALPRLSPEQYLPTINVAVSRHTRLQYARLDQILHKPEDQAIATSRGHDVDGDREDLFVERDVREVRRFADCEAARQ